MRALAVTGARGIVLLALAVGCGNNGGNPAPKVEAGGSTHAPIALDAGTQVDAAVSVGEAGLVTTGRLFPEGSPWYRDVTALAADVESPAMIAALSAAGGFGEFLVDFSFEINRASATDPIVALTP